VVAFVVGNGTSRLKVDLNKVRKHGKIYGCNALYRDFIPDCLVAVDEKMIREINESGYQYRYPVVIDPRNRKISFPGFRYLSTYLGYSSGPTALHLAATETPDTIYLLGFDFVSQTGFTNNVYASTKNYKSKTDDAAYSGNWEFQTKLIIKKNPHSEFVRVVADGHAHTLDMTCCNYKEITITEFNKFLE
jgi:hypothetical protein